jgi:hypothetical protein
VWYVRRAFGEEYIGWFLNRLLRWFFSAIVQSLSSIAQCVRTRSGRWALLSLILVLVSLGLLAKAVPSSLLFNWPLMFAFSWLLLVLLTGPLAALPLFLKKLIRVAISVCLLAGVAMLLNWQPLWIILTPFGLTRNQTGFHLLASAVCIWWVSIFWIFFSRPSQLREVTRPE